MLPPDFNEYADEIAHLPDNERDGYPTAFGRCLLPTAFLETESQRKTTDTAFSKLKQTYRFGYSKIFMLSENEEIPVRTMSNAADKPLLVRRDRFYASRDPEDLRGLLPEGLALRVRMRDPLRYETVRIVRYRNHGWDYEVIIPPGCCGIEEERRVNMAINEDNYSPEEPTLSQSSCCGDS
ncbi:unnamed protein product [Amoebophrya sp. A25]|nr:unnamed protein product [Amoebophrya sp. A25]|eukprot:GSA25T00013624001.1